MLNNMDDISYRLCQEEYFSKFEGKCNRCGACCGSQDGDPCKNLAQDEASGKYYCKVYDKRLGPQETKSGKAFNCVPIREIAKLGLLRRECGYNE